MTIMNSQHFYHSLQEEDFDVSFEHQSLTEACPSSGAIVTFTGLVRDSINSQSSKDSPNSVSSIELSTYKSMSGKQIEQLGQKLFKKFDLHGLRIIHRIGLLTPQEQIVFVGTASKHRDHAFKAAEMAMDYLKSSIAFWKKEHYTNDANSKNATESRWIEPSEQDLAHIQQWD